MVRNLEFVHSWGMNESMNDDGMRKKEKVIWLDEERGGWWGCM